MFYEITRATKEQGIIAGIRFTWIDKTIPQMTLALFKTIFHFNHIHMCMQVSNNVCSSIV